MKNTSPEKERGACLVVGVFESGKLTAAAVALDKASQGYLSELIRRGDMEGKSGATLLLYDVAGTACSRVLLVGLGKEKEFDEKAYLAAVRAAVRALGETGAPEASLFLASIPVGKRDLSWRVRLAAVAAREALYRFEHFKSKKEARRPLKKLTFCLERRDELALAEAALQQGVAIAEGVDFARDLGNTPPNVCHPVWLAEQAQALAREFKLGCEILETDALKKLGMNTLLSVARGSRQPPRLIVLSYRGAQSAAKPVVLVGKGITFDSGGISIKPSADMDEMKYDMSGAASVLGALKAAARMKLPVNLTVVVPAAENMPGGEASRPGDIVTSLSGQTVEILNTDAEGRLILCDALTYAERLDPAVVIDVATLTGACVIALGHVASGLFTAKDNLARKLVEAGDQAHDRVWRLPLWDDYQELLKSNFADMNNSGGRWGGAVSAACFLARFTKKYDWAHLDIAGTAYKSGSEKGSTGRPVSLLVHYLMGRAKLA